MSSPLDDATRQEIENRLIDEIAEVEERVMDLEDLTKPVSPDKAIGRLSRLESMNEKSIHDAALYQVRERQSKLEVALTRVYDRQFGVCTACQAPIPVERLLLLPESVQCVSCAEKN